MTHQEWIICGAEFIEGDVIRWQESVFQPSRYARNQRVKTGNRGVTAQLLFDPSDPNELMELTVLASEGTNPYKPAELIRRARRTLCRKDTERLAWSDEEARAAVVDSLPEAQLKAMQEAQSSAIKAPGQGSRTRTVQRVATGAPWRRRRASAGAYVAKP